jgi:low affinity Fe/Cu permease
MAGVDHPVDRGGEGRGPFERAAEHASNVASSPQFFAVCALLVILWAVAYALDWSTGVRSFLGEALAAVTLALVALLKNAERRSEHAIQYKLDAIANAMLETRRDEDDEDDGAEDLQRAVGRHDEV